MPFTKQYAKVLAGMLTVDQHRAMIYLAGKNPKSSQEITQELIDELVALELVKPVVKTDAKHALLLLTDRGKKVAEFV
jgi:hypothetical protein